MEKISKDPYLPFKLTRDDFIILVEMARMFLDGDERNHYPNEADVVDRMRARV